MVFRPLLIAAVSIALPAMAFAQSLIDGSNPQQILKAAQKFGAAELTKDQEGDPLIRGEIEGARYIVFFYSCTKGANCKELEFLSFYTASDGLSRQDRMARCNQFNAERRFGKAFIDQDGDYALKHPVTLRGGVSAANLDDSFDWWRAANADFVARVVKAKGTVSLPLPDGATADANKSSKQDRP
jgi:hypothetical protein